jgi:hypothetical protein
VSFHDYLGREWSNAWARRPFLFRPGGVRWPIQGLVLQREPVSRMDEGEIDVDSSTPIGFSDITPE